MTFRILEYIAKQNNKSLPKFHTEWSFLEYEEHEKKPFHRNLKSSMSRYKNQGTKNLKSNI